MLRMRSISLPVWTRPVHGTEDHAGDGVGEDGVQAEALEDAFKQLGGDDERANGKEGFVDLHPSPPVTHPVAAAEAGPDVQGRRC